MMDYKRNEAIEMQLQTALDDGANVWVIGDIHGFYQSFISLIDELNLGGKRPSGFTRRPY